MKHPFDALPIAISKENAYEETKKKFGNNGGSDAHLSMLCMSALLNKRLKVNKQ